MKSEDLIVGRPINSSRKPLWRTPMNFSWTPSRVGHTLRSTAPRHAGLALHYILYDTSVIFSYGFTLLLNRDYLIRSMLAFKMCDSQQYLNCKIPFIAVCVIENKSFSTAGRMRVIPEWLASLLNTQYTMVCSIHSCHSKSRWYLRRDTEFACCLSAFSLRSILKTQ